MGLFGDKKDNSEDDEAKSPKTYDAFCKCKNCDKELDITVLFGTTIKDYLMDKKCRDCGCAGLVKSEEEY